MSSEPDPTQLPSAQKLLALVGVLLSLFLAALDNTIVSTAGPAIQRELGIEPGLYVWITTSYLVSSTVLVPIWGKLSDLIGRRRVLLAGIVIFLLGSALCGVSANATQLILSRAVQGVGSASLFTSAFAIVADLYSPRERGKLNGFFGATFGLSSVVGPLVGGFLTDHFGWHWCFFVNLPLGVIAIVFIVARMPPLLPRVAGQGTIDLGGSIALALTVVPLLVALSFGKAEVKPGETGFSWSSWQELSLFSTSAIGLVAFLIIERQVKEPIVDLTLFKNRAFAMGTLAAFVSGLTFLGAIVFLPLFMQTVVGERATGAGLTTLPLTLGIVVGNIASGRLTSSTGKYKPVLVASIALSAVAFAILAFTLDTDATKLNTSWKMFLIGLGVGPAIPLFALAIQNAVPQRFIGVASSMSTFARQLGSTVGIALLGTVFSTALSTNLETKMKAATEGVPPALLARLQAQSSAGGESAAGEGPSRGRGFDRARVEAKVHEVFSAQKAQVHDEQALAGLTAAEAQAIETVGKVETAFKQAFTEAVRRVYLASIAIALLALFVTLLVPALPLREAGTPVAVE